MHVLMVVAHPNPDSFCHAVAAGAAAGARSAGHQVTVMDLYADGFSAAMSAGERRAYDSAQPILDPMVAASVELVRDCQAIVFVYPTWWSTLPAILKGWLDRVLVPGVAIVFDERGKVRSGLGHVRHLVGISTYGSPRLYVKAVNDNGRRTIGRAVRMACGWRTRCRWMALYAIDRSTPDQRAAFIESVRRRMAAL
jgi:putative NADPH-quinone reductase